MKTFADPAAEFVLASRSIFGDVRVLDVEHRLGMVEVKGDIERALREAKERVNG